MFDLATLLAASIMVAVTFYTLLGGADFGGGVWDLLALGPRARQQRDLIAEAISPIWEANHVWLIVAIVILFVCFPPAFAEIMTALFVPMILMLVGIVLRGSAFVFRAYGAPNDAARRVYGAVFAAASVVTPFFLGVAIGSIGSGRIERVAGVPPAGFAGAWLGAFPIAMGAMVVCLFALLGAVYLAVEARDDALRDDFRRRALAAAVATGALAIVNLFLVRWDAPALYEGFVSRPWTLLAIGASVIMGLALMVSLWRRRIHEARALAVLQAVGVIWTWGFAQYPYLVLPDLTIQQAAGPDIVLAIVLAGLAAGGFILFPSLYLLYRVFKGERAFPF